MSDYAMDQEILYQNLLAEQAAAEYESALKLQAAQNALIGAGIGGVGGAGIGALLAGRENRALGAALGGIGGAGIGGLLGYNYARTKKANVMAPYIAVPTPLTPTPPIENFIPPVFDVENFHPLSPEQQANIEALAEARLKDTFRLEPEADGTDYEPNQHAVLALEEQLRRENAAKQQIAELTALNQALAESDTAAQQQIAELAQMNQALADSGTAAQQRIAELAARNQMFSDAGIGAGIGGLAGAGIGALIGGRNNRALGAALGGLGGLALGAGAGLGYNKLMRKRASYMPYYFPNYYY
jgi:hypothetical protein